MRHVLAEPSGAISSLLEERNAARDTSSITRAPNIHEGRELPPGLRVCAFSVYAIPLRTADARELLVVISGTAGAAATARATRPAGATTAARTATATGAS